MRPVSRLIKRTLKLGLLLLPYSLIFHFGWYRYVTVPDSLTHGMEATIHQMRAHQEARLVIMGDSTSRQSFLFDTYNRYSQQQSINLGLAGSGVLPLHKLAMEFSRPDRSALVIMCGDQFRGIYQKRLIYDLQSMKTWLGIRDLPLLWYYSPTVKDFFAVLAGWTFRASLYRRDLQDLIQHPEVRWQAIQSNWQTFHRPVKPYSPIGENDWAMDISGFEDCVKIQALEFYGFGPPGPERRRREAIWNTYENRRVNEPFDPQAQEKLNRLLEALSSRFQHVFITPAPFFQEYTAIYSAQYQQEMARIMATNTSHYVNVTYIPRDPAIDSDPRNFQDVVHTNRRGAAAFTLYAGRYLERHANMPMSPLLVRALEEIAH